MATSRSSTANAPAPDGARLLSLLQQKPLETLGALGALGATLGTALSGLGFVTLRAREALLGLSPGLSYPKQEWLVTGFDALGALLWRGLSVLTSDYPVLQWSAWALLLLLLGLLLARSTRRTAVLLGMLAVSALLLVVGTAFYRTALAASSPRDAGPSRGFHCGTRLSANLMDRAAFETCSWLVNDTARNDDRRSDLGGLLGWLLAPCLTAPAGLEVEPNAIQDPAQPMVIRVAGIPRGETAHLQVLQDCDRDDRPDLQGTAECRSPLQEWDSAPAGAEGVDDRLDFQALRAQGNPLPADRRLWLRASRRGSNQALYALFGLVEDPCTLWQSLLATFARSSCRLGLPQALLKHRGAGAWKSGPYEVRRLDLGTKPFRPVPVPGTRGATGLSWLDERTLLVTIAPASGASRLLRVPLSGGAPEVLWEAPAGDARRATAPLALPGGRVAFVRQKPGASAALLSVWENGSVDAGRDLELPAAIHQLAAADPAGTEILALTLGAGENRPAFLKIDLASRQVEDLGFHPALYQAIFSSPRGDRAIVAFEDNSGQTGWDLALVDASGKLLEDVQSRPEDDLLPAWQPGGGGLAFVAEVEADAVKP